MLAGAARDLGVPLHVQTPSGDDPATRLAAGVVVAPVEDAVATRELARRCRAISFENEWIPLEALVPLARDGVCFLPDLDALRPLVSKRGQRELLDQLHLPCPRWCPLDAVLAPVPAGEAGLPAAAVAEGSAPPDAPAGAGGTAIGAPESPPTPRHPEGFQYPLMAKASTGGYDGKGTAPLQGPQDLEALLGQVDPAGWILEEMVAFEQELALVACRDRQGRVACFPLVQTHQHRQVCDWVLFPAPVNHAVDAFARNVAASLLTSLDYVGVLSIEFFYGPGGLQVNELAPRTHNSGHLTIEACRTSQFAQQVRIVSGLPMGSTEPVLPGALMVNLLGFETSGSDFPEQRRALERLPGAHLHWYGKRGSQPGRKLGHLTLALEGRTHAERALERVRLLEEVRRIWPLPVGPEDGQTP